MHGGSGVTSGSKRRLQRLEARLVGFSLQQKLGEDLAEHVTGGVGRAGGVCDDADVATAATHLCDIRRVKADASEVVGGCQDIEQTCREERSC